MPIALDEYFVIGTGEAEKLIVDFSGRLLDTDTLTNPSAVKDSGGTITIDSVAVNTNAVEVPNECRTIPVGQAVEFRVSAGSGIYGINVKADTTNSPTRTFERIARLEFK